MITFVDICVGVVTLSWIPLIFRQLQRFRRREQPESGAIASAMIVLMAGSSVPLWRIRLPSDDLQWLCVIVWGMVLVTCLHFHWAYWTGPRRRSAQQVDKRL